MTTATIPVDFVELEDSSSLPFTPLFKESFQLPKDAPATRYRFPEVREKEDAWTGVTSEPLDAFVKSLNRWELSSVEYRPNVDIFRILFCLLIQKDFLRRYQTIAAGEEKSPFEELYALLPAEERVERTIECARNLRSLPYAKRIAKRLRWLHQASLDEEDEAGIVPESLSSFLEFMESVQGLQYPDIVLSPEGNLVARWRADQNRNLCIEFLSQDARFVVFAPDPNRTLRVSGVVPLAKLWETLKPYSIERWVVNDNRG